MLTGENGILTQAQNAKNKTEEAETEERTDLDRQNALIDNLANEKSLVQPGVVVDSTIKNNYIDTNGDKATVPAGFTVSAIESEQKVSEGLVIYDIPEGVTPNWTEDLDSDGEPDIKTKYNQFVWIPVVGEADYQRDFSYPSYYGSSSETTPEGSTFTDTGYLPDKIQPSKDDAISNENAERTAVLKYNGFYIGRYEAGKENETTAVSKQNAIVWTEITQTESKDKAKTMYADNNSVKSALCSGIQWDMVMHFVDKKMDGTGDKVFDVRVADPDRHTGSKAESGKNINDKVQNIYDLEGNSGEYIAEKNNDRAFINRGGDYNNYQNTRSVASLRYAYNGNGTINRTFRPVLYIM